MKLYFLLTLVIASFLLVPTAQALAIDIQDTYKVGDKLVVIGTATPDTFITVKVFNSYILAIAQEKSDSNGLWSVNVTTLGKEHIGEWSIMVYDTSTKESVVKTFKVVETTTIVPTDTTTTDTTVTTTNTITTTTISPTDLDSLKADISNLRNDINNINRNMITSGQLTDALRTSLATELINIEERLKAMESRISDMSETLEIRSDIQLLKDSVQPLVYSTYVILALVGILLIVVVIKDFILRIEVKK